MELREIKALMDCFGDRYINVTNEQAQIDAKYGRDRMVAAFNAILSAVEMTLDASENS